MANTDFSAKLLELLSDKENSVISPYGIETVLAMVSEGADEEGEDEIASSLGFQNCGEFSANVLLEMNIPCGAMKSENKVTLVKGLGDVELLERFKKTMKDIYYADVREEKSQVESMVQLKNISTFKAEWLYTMERDVFKDNIFTNADGSICRPVFLNCEEKLNCYKSSKTKAVAIPYKYDDEKTPYELVLIDSEKPLSASTLNEIFSNMTKEKCYIEFPEFKINSEYDLIPMMQALGLNSIFDETKCVLTQIATRPMYAKAFGQKAEIKVDKNGTVAKAFTCMFDYIEGGITLFIERFVFTKPFNYFLRNTLSGEILFMGKVNKLSNFEDRKSL